MPAIAWWPGKIQAGAVTGELAAGFDLWPTMAELTGTPLLLERPMDGLSIAPVLLEGKSLGRQKMFWEFEDAVAMRDGPWKYIAREDDFEGPGLFNLAEDLGEQTNLADRFSDRTKSMAEAVTKWFQDVEGSATAQPSSR